MKTECSEIVLIIKNKIFLLIFSFIFTSNVVCVINNENEIKTKILLISPNVLTRML